VLSGEATHANFIVFGLTRPGLEPTIYLPHVNNKQTFGTANYDNRIFLYSVDLKSSHILSMFK